MRRNGLQRIALGPHLHHEPRQRKREPVHVVGLDVEDLPKASTSELLGYSEEDAALDAQLDRDVDLVVSVLRDQTGWLDWDGLEQRTHIPAPRLNDAIDLLVSQGVIQRDVNRFRLEG